MTKKNATPNDLAKLVLRKLNGAKASFSIPNEEVINLLFETLFFASLKTEESQLIKVTVTLIDPENPDPNPPNTISSDRWKCIYFDDKIDFTVKNLVKLSKAADPWSSSLAVYYDSDNSLKIWGMIDQAIHYQSFLNYEHESEPEKPGLFQTTIMGIGNLVVLFDYELIANLKQNILISYYPNVFRLGPIANMLVDNTKAYKEYVTPILKKVFPSKDVEDWHKHVEDIYIETLSRLLLRIQNYQHGGAVLLTKKIGSELDIKHRINYDRLASSIMVESVASTSYLNFLEELIEKYIEKSEETIPSSLYLDSMISQIDNDETKSELKGAIRYISSLSCIDGLIVMTPDLKVKGFGAVIKFETVPKTIYVSTSAHINESKLVVTNSDHFGTRHRSMFSYCWDNLGSLGFVISQDGDIRAITRIQDKLLMWENIKVLQFKKSKKLRPLLKNKKK